jgi:hypothetical protein
MKIISLIISAVLLAFSLYAVIVRTKKNKDGKNHVLPPAYAFWIILVLSFLYAPASFALVIVNKTVPVDMFLIHVFFFLALGLSLFALSNCDCVFDGGGCVFTTVIGSKREYAYSDFVAFTVGISKSNYTIKTSDGKTMHFDNSSDGFDEFLHTALKKNRSFKFEDKRNENSDRPDPYNHNVIHGWLFFILYAAFALGGIAGTVYGADRIKDAFAVKEYTHGTGVFVECNLVDYSFFNAEVALTMKDGTVLKSRRSLGKYYNPYELCDGKTEYELTLYGDYIISIYRGGREYLTAEQSEAAYRNGEILTGVITAAISQLFILLFILSLAVGRNPKKHPLLYNVMFYKDFRQEKPYLR